MKKSSFQKIDVYLKRFLTAATDGGRFLCFVLSWKDQHNQNKYKKRAQAPFQPLKGSGAVNFDQAPKLWMNEFQGLEQVL